MSNPSQNLIFDIDVEELDAIRMIHGATEAQMRAAYNRAISRTSVTLKKLTAKKYKDALQVKNAKLIRKRLQQFRIKSPSKQRKLDELKLWFGLNDMPVGHLKGRVQRVGTKKSPQGATFTPRGAAKAQRYKEGFVAKRYGRRSIFTRTTKKSYPVKEARVSISDELSEVIEDDIFSQVPEIFLHHYEADIKGRVRMGLNKNGWKS
ncbi:hypothetical protein [Vibrio sp. St2]|uniref:hypothetical protein n=1 Tax=Vibrio sp. St2 TaxID=2853441 RepID=UPI00248D81C0|nr:hypothetical protein [Vibrio sp. St2]